MASDLPIDVLEEIFLRLDDVADLARASAACASFRRVVSNSRFLRRFRSLHCRPVLGLLRLDDPSRHRVTEFLPAQSPRRSALAAGAFAKGADFTFSFLPDRSHWRVCDARDGRVLLTRCPNRHYMFEDLMVYDPLHRRHVQIPTIPGDLLLAAEQDDGNNKTMAFDDPFLAPAAAENERDDDVEGFRVMMCTCLSKTKVVVMAFVFSSASGQWRCAASFSNNPSYAWTSIPLLWSRQCVHSCVCLTYAVADALLVLDTREMKFSVVDLPQECIGKSMIAVEAGDGRLGLLLLLNYLRRDFTAMDLYSKAWRQGNGGVIQESEEWRHDSSIPVPGGFHLSLARAAEGYVLLLGISRDQLDRCFRNRKKNPNEAHYFTLELKTLLVEKLCVLEYDSRPRPNFLYTSFPPPFSPPTV